MLKGALEENFDQLHHQGCQRNLSGSKSNKKIETFFY